MTAAKKTTTRTKRTKDILALLSPDDALELLRELLRRHPKLRAEAESIVKDQTDDVSVENVAWEVFDLASTISLGELNSRAGRQPWGYVDASEAAWELLKEAMAGPLGDLTRTIEMGRLAAAEKICLGIVLGLHRAVAEDGDGALRYAADGPMETAADSLSQLLKQVPRTRRQAVGRRILAGASECPPIWITVLERVVARAVEAGAKPKRRKKRS